MAAPTRLALVSVIILVGCVFAIPHFRHPTGDVEKSDVETGVENPATDLTLKITPDDDDKADTKSANPVALRDVDLQKNSVLVQHPVKPPTPVKEEEWKFPPISKFGETRSGDTGTRQVALKPTRLMGNNIGQQFDSNNIGQFAERRSTTQSFASNAGQPFTKLSPQPLPNNQRSASRRTTQPRQEEANLHRVVNGDTLEKLSQQYYGSPQQALIIFEANRQALFSPAILPIGLDLKIPNLDAQRQAAQQAGQFNASQKTAGLQPLRPRPVRPVTLP